MKYNIMNLNVFVIALAVNHFSFSDLVSLDDDDLGFVDGAGIGLVLEDFIYEAGSKINGGATFELAGLKSSEGEDVVVDISQFYIAGFGSNRGKEVIGNPVNVGRLNNPFNFELRDGNKIGISNKAVLEFSAPDNNNFSSRFGQNEDIENNKIRKNGERPDIGVRFDLNIGGNDKQTLENHIESLSIDGSYIRLWGDKGKTHANLAVNIYTPLMTFLSCDSNGANCGEAVQFQDVSIESELGYGDKQTVTFEVNGGGDFVFEVGTLEGANSFKNLCGSFNDSGGCSNSAGESVLEKFYTEGPASNIFIGNVSVGGKDFGSSTVSNLQIQYLHVQSHDL